MTTGGAGRFAPSPSADLHIGNLRTALLAWMFARSTERRTRMLMAAAAVVVVAGIGGAFAWGSGGNGESESGSANVAGHAAPAKAASTARVAAPKLPADARCPLAFVSTPRL